MAEAQVDAGVRHGMPSERAAELVVQTMAGTAALLRHRGYDTLAVRRQVTSPGGSTARGLDALERGGVRAAFSTRWTRSAGPGAGRERRAAGPGRRAAEIADYVRAIILVYIILIIAYILSSLFFSFGGRVPYSRWSSAILGFLRDVCEPYLGIFRRFIPPLGPDRPQPDRRDLRPADRRRHHRQPHRG